MDDFVAYPSRWRIALMVLGAWMFVALGLWMLGVFGPPPSEGRYSPAVVMVIGFGGVVFFGLCGVVGIGRLFDQREQVRIGPAGVLSIQWSGETIPWSEIVEVTTWSYRGQKAIILRLRDRTRFPGRGLPALLAGANRSLTGGDLAISLTGTNGRFEDALAAIARFRS